MGHQAAPAEAVGTGQHHWAVQQAQADGALVVPQSVCRWLSPLRAHLLHSTQVWADEMLLGLGCSTAWLLARRGSAAPQQ